jgi:hypothetical protein
MKYLHNLEFEINYRLRQLIEQHGLMSTDDPRVVRLFQNFSAIRKLQQTAVATNPDQADHHKRTVC